MKNAKLLITLSILIAAVFISQTALSKLTNFTTVNRAGDPVGPGVTSSKNCTGCHTGTTAVSNDTMSRIFTFGTGQTSYLPGTVYNVKFKIKANNPVGFSATVLRNDSNTMAGVLTPADTAETKIFVHMASGRAYLNHRVGDVTAGMKEYSFTWTAPALGTGPVTFYISSLTSNNDQSSDFDTTFLNHYVIAEGTPPVGISEVSKAHTFVAYPNPATDRIHVGFLNSNSSNTLITMYSLNGKENMILLNENLSAGMQDLSFDLAGVKPGIYFIRVSNESINNIQKVLVY